MEHKQLKTNRQIRDDTRQLEFTTKGVWIGLIAYLLLIGIIATIIIFG